ncbi:MAG TPA: acetyl-CoA C-acetyltransferase [Saprospiraceae bacterium]|nr:acetyl-CoA C-acetyltransferase [Saprospiraceae bacterium]HMP25611.1 acetyl-CoA C-acetyltransferase [Saprospiraceae bacterium]
MTEAYIYDAVRTPRGRGRQSGALYEVKPVRLLEIVLRALATRTHLDTNAVDDAILGCVTPVDDQGFNIAKAALLYAGWSKAVSGMQINRYCASGLEAVNLAATKIRAGWADLVVAGGVESMSRVPIGSDGGALLYDPEVIARVNYIPQGVSADLIATIEGFSRTTVDEYALLSQQRAAQAMQNDYFNRSILPIYDQNGLLILDRDEHPRPDTTLEGLAQLPPAFAGAGSAGFNQMALRTYPAVEKIQHVHTAGNSSGIVDGAAALLLGSKEKGAALGLSPRARIVGIANVSTEPVIMLTGPAPAARKALQMAKMTAADIDLWECNEAFATVPLKFQRELELDIEKLNVNGGAIALGHPLGATGAMLLGTLLDELERRDLNVGLVTLCAGGGMGIATIIERV